MEHPFAPKIDDDHQCQVRRSFTSKQQATAAQRRIYNRTGFHRPVQSCRHCGGWHLGDAK